MRSLTVKIKKFLRRIYGWCAGLVYTDVDFSAYQKDFLILPGCRDESLREQYRLGNLVKLDRPLNYYFDALWESICKAVAEKQPFVYVRVSDGEGYFLRGRLVGNGPKRHYTSGKSLDPEYINKFKQGLLECDSRHIEMYKSHHKIFRNIYGREIFSPIPFECLYAMVAGKKLFRSGFKIGLIGSVNKLKIIKELISFPEYQDYIGLKSFEDYIPVPETGTSNDIGAVVNLILPKLKPEVDIYLVGIGIAKLAVLPELKKISNSIFFDAGAGISALAGLVSPERPYFADWINFRLKDYRYENVDIMDADMSKGKILAGTK